MTQHAGGGNGGPFLSFLSGSPIPLGVCLLDELIASKSIDDIDSTRLIYDPQTGRATLSLLEDRHDADGCDDFSADQTADADAPASLRESEGPSLEVFLYLPLHHPILDGGCPQREFVRQRRLGVDGSLELIKPKSVSLACSTLVTDRACRRVLLTRRPAHMRSFPKAWVLPGGKVDPHERLVDAALRELFEETGIAVRIVEDENPSTMISAGESSGRDREAPGNSSSIPCRYEPNPFQCCHDLPGVDKNADRILDALVGKASSKGLGLLAPFFLWESSFGCRCEGFPEKVQPPKNQHLLVYFRLFLPVPAESVCVEMSKEEVDGYAWVHAEKMVRAEEDAVGGGGENNRAYWNVGRTIAGFAAYDPDVEDSDGAGERGKEGSSGVFKEAHFSLAALRPPYDGKGEGVSSAHEKALALHAEWIKACGDFESVSEDGE